MRIARLEKHQKPTETPTSHLSKKRAEKFIIRGIARWLIVGKVLQMLKDAEEIRGDSHYLLPDYRQITVAAPAKRKRWNRNLLLFYPHRSQESQFCYGQRLSR